MWTTLVQEIWRAAQHEWTDPWGNCPTWAPFSLIRALLGMHREGLSLNRLHLQEKDSQVGNLGLEL